MEKIKIGNTEYEILSIDKRGNLLTIVFPVPANLPKTELSSIEVLTEGGIHCTTISGYTTMYKGNGTAKVILSNDGSVYTEPIIPDPVPPYVPTPEELLDSAKSAKLSEISEACQKAVYDGVDIAVSGGTKHFSLNLEDQTNIAYAENAVRLGATEFPYHADGELCSMYSAADIMVVASGSAKHKLYHTTYCNHLNAWIRRSTIAEEVDAISYGDDLPADLKANFDTIVGGMA